MGEQLTEMERLCMELMGCVCEYYPAAQFWCDEHSVETSRYVCRKNAEDARDDVERRIAAARFHDGDLAKAYSEAVGYLEGIRARLRAEGEHLQDAAEDRMEKADALEELREAGRVMPEGVSWPRYEDGEPVRMGGEVEGGKVAWITLNDSRYEICNSADRLLCTDLHGRPVKRPDSWEQMELDAGKSPWRYCLDRGIPYRDDGFGEMAGDLVARAKAMAEGARRG